jgi:predicted amidohydrolase YtcJ
MVATAFLLLSGLAAGPADAAERTMTMRAGPYTVGGFNTERPKVLVRSPRVNGYITHMHSRLVDRRGRPVTIQRVMLHHVVFLNQGRFPGDRKTRCGARFGEAFYGTGEENQSLDLPAGYGYRIRPGDRWKMQTMLMSHQAQTQQVYVQYRMRVVTRRPLQHVTPYWVRVTDCRNEPSYSVSGGGAPGSVHRRTNTWTVPQNGRIVAGGAHLHGGAHNIELTQPACDGRRLMASDPSYGTPDYISYRVKPLLHEPGPINTAWYTSRRGVPVRKGERLDVTALYDAQWAHPGVMGVYHVYVARDRAPAARCPRLPADARETGLRGAHREHPPHVVVPLTELDARGRPVTLPEPRGPLSVFDPGRTSVLTRVRATFSRPRMSVAPGTKLTWSFDDPIGHKVSIANGPRAMGSPTLSGGKRFSWTPRTPGRYQLFCYLHPTTMHQQVDVRAPDGSAPAIPPTAPGGDPGLPPNGCRGLAGAGGALRGGRARRRGDVLIRLSGGPVRTLDPRRPVEGGITLRGAQVAELGGDGDGPAIDLAGRCVVPGLSDAHTHFATWAIGLGQVRLEGCASRDEAVARAAGAAARVPDGRWVRGLGWRDADWGESPSREALDAALGDAPVALWSRDYHSLWLSTAALARAGGDLHTPGGVVEAGADGAPSGILREDAAWRFRDRYLRPTQDEMEEAMRAALPVAAARGVTAVHDKDGWLGILPVWQRLLDAGELSLRVWQSLPHHMLDELADLGIRSGFGPERLRIGYLKAFMDGTLGSRTARMLDGTGVEITSGEALAAIVRRAARAGFPVAVHAIGDRANREALDAFEATQALWTAAGLRPRIEHAQLLAPEDVGRFAAIGVAASVQFSHAPSDRELADEWWGERAALAYAWRALEDSGAVLANGSDAPVEELDPLLGLRAGITRTLDERPPWRPEQALGAEAALRASVTGPAWLAREEHRRGRLAPGFDADLVVLSRDPVTCPPEELADVRVEATMVAGEWTHPGPFG